MIPNNSITLVPEVSTWEGPENGTYTPLVQIVYGGVALNDPSLGRTYQNWRVLYNGTSITVNPVSNSVVFTLTISGVTSVSLAFDNNMSPVIAYLTAAGASVYYFDGSLGTFTTKTFAGATSCRVAVDDPREVNFVNSDVIFAYTLGSTLYWRQQRDKYAVEYTVGATTNRLIKLGRASNNRLQFGLTL